MKNKDKIKGVTSFNSADFIGSLYVWPCFDLINSTTNFWYCEGNIFEFSHKKLVIGLLFAQTREEIKNWAWILSVITRFACLNCTRWDEVGNFNWFDTKFLCQSSALCLSEWSSYDYNFWCFWKDLVHKLVLIEYYLFRKW